MIAPADVACLSHHPSAEARDTTAMTSLRLLAVLDVPSSTPARAKRRAPRPDGPLTHFTSPRGEKGRLALYDRSGRLTAFVEVKNKRETSHEWAAQTRRNILAHGGLCNADFFLLVTPNRLYMWKDAGTDPFAVPPSYEADTQSAFAPYFESAGVDPERISGQAFELLVAAWLSDVIRAEETTGGSGTSQSWLVKSGFHTAVKDGRIEYQAVL